MWPLTKTHFYDSSPLRGVLPTTELLTRSSSSLWDRLAAVALVSPLSSAISCGCSLTLETPPTALTLPVASI